jgi:hypothetical protein
MHHTLKLLLASRTANEEKNANYKIARKSEHNAHYVAICGTRDDGFSSEIGQHYLLKRGVGTTQMGESMLGNVNSADIYT